MSYTNTFIRTAPDSNCHTAKVPPLNPDQRTVASLQHELLTTHPGALTEKELHYRVHCLRQGLSPAEMESRRATLWAELFRKPQACLRASPLPKTYGWGVHYDADGLIRLVAVESPDYKRLSDSTLQQTNAMRSRRST